MSANEDLQKQACLKERSSDASQLEIIKFFSGSWKTIITFGFLGVVIAVVYISVAPKQYEAFAQVKMAQISYGGPLGSLLEDSSTLIARMKIPSNYDAVTVACGYHDKPQSAEQLSKAVKITPIKGVANIVEIRVLTQSHPAAQKCLLALVDLIAFMQMQVAMPLVEEAKLKIAQDNQRIEDARKLIVKADSKGGDISGAYLAARDEISYFLTDREKMSDFLVSIKHRGTKLFSPIYVPSQPVAPQRGISLIMGLLGGIFMGLFVAFAIQMWAMAGRPDEELTLKSRR